jgi:anti-sigma regulatory factor (Ser/Thr protein kinase)
MVITFEIESRLEQVRLIRAALTGVLDHLRVTEPDIMSLELAVTEVANNSIEHGYEGRDNETVKVKIEVRGKLVQVAVIDNAPEFPDAEKFRLADDAPEAQDAAYDEWPVRGRGLQIVKQIVDSIQMKFEDSQNIVTLSKKVVMRED